MASPADTSIPRRSDAHAPGIRRYLLALLSVLTAIPLLWLGNSYATRTAEANRRAHEQSLVTLAQAVARQLDTMLDGRCRDLEVLAGSIEVLGELQGPEVEAILREHWQRSHYYTGMYVADADGNPLVRAPRDAGPAATNYRDRDYYRELIRTEQTAISRVQEGRVTHAANVQIATPIKSRSGRLVGYVEGSVELDTFAALVHHAAAGVAGSRIVVLDGTPSVVADSSQRAAAGAPYQKVLPTSTLGSAPGGLGSARDEKGELLRVAFENGGAKLESWRVLATRSQRSIDENARRIRNETWASAGALWLVVFLIAAAVSARFGRRLSELVNAVGERTAELGRLNERLTILVNALERADDGIEITGPDARFIYVNPAFQRITGYSASELVGKTPSILRSKVQDTAFYDAIWQRVSSGQVYSGTLVGQRKDGSWFDQELTVWPILDDSGAITHYVGLRRDVTERRRTEQALRVSERLASLGTLAAGVAHEINNPLTYVTLNLNFVRDQIRSLGFETERQADRFQLAVDRALEGSERVSAIVKDLRTLSRSDDGAVTVVDPRALLESALRMVGNDIRHRADLREDFGPIPAVVANEVRLSQVFVNLLVNAVQALVGGDGKENQIEVRTRTDERGFAVVEVSDTGSGIHAEHLHKIFDPFFTTKPGLGTGIGLSLCHSTVKAMGGEIQVESSVGRGSLFRILLPPAANAPSVAPQGGPAESVRRTLAPQRVLVMDDNLAVGEALKQALPGHDVTVVCSAAAGLDAARTCRFSAIFCDVIMPGMTGIDFYERLAEIDPMRSSRVVFITGGVLTEEARKFLDQHDAPCLEKPVSVEQLEAALARVSAASEQPPAQRAAEPVASRARTARR